MKNNINKDIEIVKEIITHKDDYDVFFGYRIAKPYPISAEEIQSISNVLSELEEKIEQIKVLENNNRVLDISLGRELETHKDTNKELEKYKKAYELETYERQKFIDELETYKKIAEKLAEDLSKHIWLNDKEAIIKIYREKVEEDEVYS